MDNLNETLGGLVLVIGAVLIVFIIAKYNYQIKRAMIEKGLAKDKTDQKLRYFDIGCIIVGLGFGLLVSSIFTTMNLSEDLMDLLIWGTISIFGGSSMIAAHFIRAKLEK